MKIFKKLRQTWRKIRPMRMIEGTVIIKGMNDLPSELGKKVFLIGEKNPKWAVLSCPCGCGDRLDVNLMQTRNPHWVVSIKNNTISLDPSLWQPKEKCGSHFWLKKNRIDWV